MCDVCKNVETGNDYLSLVGEDIPLGFVGIMSIDLALCRNHNDAAVMELGCCMNNSDS